MSERFEKGTYVVYGKVGACLVAERQTMSFGAGEEGEYYVLNPVGDSRSSVYVPCDNPTLVGRMRPLMTREEIDRLLAGITDSSMVWPEDKNERATAFRTVVASGDRSRLLQLIRCLYQKKQEKTDTGRRLSTMDEMFLQEAMRLVEEEFAVALNLPRRQVPEYIRRRVEGKEK